MKNVSGRSGIRIMQVATKLEAGGTSQGVDEGDVAAAAVAFDHLSALLLIARFSAQGQNIGREDLTPRFCVLSASSAGKSLAAGGYGVVEFADEEPSRVCREELEKCYY